MVNEQSRDEQLWRLAQKRAKFRRHLFTYIVINAFLWGIWWFTVGRHDGFRGYPWPIWTMLGWGIGLAFNYFDAYQGSKEDIAQQEYEKLKKRTRFITNLFYFDVLIITTIAVYERTSQII